MSGFDRNGDLHGSHGKFEKQYKDVRHGDRDLPPDSGSMTGVPGVVSDRAAWANGVKARVESLARDHDAEGAAREARAAGAFVAGDRLPYGRGLAAVWDGRELRSVVIDGARVEDLGYFDENSLPYRR